MDGYQTDEEDEGYIIYLDMEELDECVDPEELLNWYVDASHLVDDIAAQIEVHGLAPIKGEDWLRRASGVLIGLKKKMKRMERRAAAIGCELPRKRKSASDQQLEKYRQRAFEARTFERRCVVEWLEETYGDEVSHVVAALNALEHHKRRLEAA